MKIFQVISHSDLGGAQSVLISLANRLSIDNEVIVVSGSRDGEMFSMLSPDVKIETLDCLQRDISLIRDFKAIWSLRRLYNKYKPDIIHLHTAKIGVLGRLIFPRKITIYTVHGFDAIRVAHRIFLPLERILQYRCSCLVGVSQYDVRMMQEEKVRRNVCCIYNGIERPSGVVNFSFEKYNDFEKIILCIARMSPQKNDILFIEIASRFPQYAFIWVGNQYPVNRPIPRNVFFEGSIPNAGVLCRDVDLFLLTSNYEGLPMSIIEAMSYGKPVVASNVGGISEIVISDYNGFVAENTVEDFCDKIARIFSSNEKWKYYSSNSRLLYEERLTVSRMVKAYYNLYKRILY